MDTIAILILAAGASRRMRGADKLLQEVRGLPLLRDRAVTALATGCKVWLTLPVRALKRRAVLADLPVDLVEVADAGDGMAASLRAGMSALPETTEGVVVLLSDMPDITSDDIVNVINALRRDTNAHIWRGTSVDGIAGHPVLFPRWCFPALLAVTGDQGARDVLRANADRVATIALPDQHALTDLDTPEAWAKWRAAAD
ncbi:nucleotidyltransferase family protein [Pseudogemmobacter sp. W21_MBD1_M6]|uniref:nucleotidyltransferase family protein n=1 Tax=Pseudogemmobacter sp. W21_MBD1_M6 TaxID=3240271 RepID=UPI003F958839